MANYKITERAEFDLIRIYQHGVRNYGLTKADIYYDAFLERFGEIASNPYLYQSADNIS